MSEIDDLKRRAGIIEDMNNLTLVARIRDRESPLVLQGTRSELYTVYKVLSGRGEILSGVVSTEDGSFRADAKEFLG